jgi:phosphoglycolate phosphatase
LKKYIIFDFDGTIADSHSIFSQEAVKILKKYLQKIGYNENNHIGLRELLKQLSIPRWKLLLYAHKIRKNAGEKIKTEALIFDGLKNIIENLANNFTLAIVSSNSQENIIAFLKRNGIFNHFELICSNSSLFGKDVLLRKIVKKLGIRLQDVYYIGDEERDIDAAKKAGIKIIAVSWGYNSYDSLKQATPDFLVSDPQQILEILI